MKKIICGISFILLSSLYTTAQTDTRIGALLGYGSEIESVGIGVVGEIPLFESFTIAPSFVYFFPRDQVFVKTSIFEVNGNLNYYFMELESFAFYGLGGINYTTVKVEADGFGLGDYSESEGKIGANIGGGATFNFGKNWIPFAELKYVVSDFDQLVINAGIKFNI